MNAVAIKKVRGCTNCHVVERGGELEVQNLEVSVFFRNQGVGTKMLDKVKAFGKIVRLYPEAERGRVRDLLRFYRRNGFKPCTDGFWRWKPTGTAVKVVVALALLLLPSVAMAAPPQGFADKMADAIYIAEGGSKTKWPYGVKSVKVKDTAEARKVTINSVNNNWQRWEKAGKPGAFIPFMAARWCPVATDPTGNKNWTANVTKLMGKDAL